MFKHNELDHRLEIIFDTDELGPHQIRLVKTINANLHELLTTKNEHHYFEKGQELMRLIALAIKNAHFVQFKEKSSIPYANQAIEFALDDLNEILHSPSINRFLGPDN